ncbi:MAG TPA: nuclear transport factor 2 family protein [Gammaproteobacteria bacterium]|nr:nuclear transport factor 2 family protein [Gammaproteobacteria bacterium]
MTETEACELARAYVALSNAHRVELIRPMFAADAIYRSSAVGEFQGVDAIAEMMRNFFARYTDAFWLCEHFRCQANRVSFDFSLQASDAQSGAQLQRSGIERIEFDNRGLIKRLEVKTA